MLSPLYLLPWFLPACINLAIIVTVGIYNYKLQAKLYFISIPHNRGDLLLMLVGNSLFVVSVNIGLIRNYLL